VSFLLLLLLLLNLVLTKFESPTTICSKDPIHAFYRQAASAALLCTPVRYSADLFSQSSREKENGEFTVATPCVWEDCPA
jgi:hypothetical protein